MQSPERDWLISALIESLPDTVPETASDSVSPTATQAPEHEPTGEQRLASVTCSTSSLLTAARDEGVAAAVFHALRHQPCWTELPDALTTALARTAKQAIAWEIISHAAQREALEALAADGIDCLLLKGAALAHLLYPAPHARPRGDTDLLVPDRATAERAWRVLSALGYQRILGVQGRYISHQFACTRHGANDTAIMFDIHWRLSNSNFFAQRFSFADLWAERRPVPPLGPRAYALSARHALIHALFHRAWHLGEGDPDRLIWLYDIHLLCASFTTDDWRAFVDAVQQRGLHPLCRDGLHNVAALFATPIPPDLDAALSASPPRGLLHQLHLKQPGWRRRLADLLSLPSWPQRLGFIRETLFPDADYMRQRFGATSRWQLPAAYLRRAIRKRSTDQPL
jgi:hypothetical protein